MEKENVVAVPAESVQRMIQKTIFAASAQETRYVLNGVQWVCGPKGFELVATDGRRLAVASQEAIAGAKDFKIIVPSKILNELTRFLNSEKPAEGATIDVGVSTNQIGFRINQTTFISRLIEGNFPNYEQVIPAKVDITFEADTKELLAVTRRAALCTSDRGGAVKYQMTAGTLMATNIPTHNITEVCNATIACIKDPKIEIKDLMKIIKGPDFPTGGIIAGRSGIRDYFETGRGSVRIKARSEIEEMKGGREAIIITEIPYQVNKTTLIQNIAQLVRDKKVPDISDIRDESDRRGMAHYAQAGAC